MVLQTAVIFALCFKPGPEEHLLKLDASRPITLKLRDSDLLIREARSQSTLRFEVRGKASKISNGVRTSKSDCVLRVPRGLALKKLVIDSSSDLGDQKPFRALRSTTLLKIDELEIRGALVTVDLRVESSNVDIHLEKGSITLRGDTNARLSTDDGDIAIVQSRSIALNFTVDRSQYCLAAQNISLVNATNATTAVLGGSGNASVVVAEAPRGAVYATTQPVVIRSGFQGRRLDDEAVYYWRDTTRWRTVFFVRIVSCVLQVVIIRWRGEKFIF